MFFFVFWLNIIIISYGVNLGQVGPRGTKRVIRRKVGFVESNIRFADHASNIKKVFIMFKHFVLLKFANFIVGPTEL